MPSRPNPSTPFIPVIPEITAVTISGTMIIFSALMNRSPMKRQVSNAPSTNLAPNELSSAPLNKPLNASAVTVAKTSAIKICQWVASRFIHTANLIPGTMESHLL